jgi:hypothetical protein
MKTLNNVLLSLSGALLGLLASITLQCMLIMRTPNVDSYDWLQWTMQIVWLLLGTSIGLRVSLSILLDKQDSVRREAVGPIEISDDLDTALRYIESLEHHCTQNDTANSDKPYIPYAHTELQLQIQEFKKKIYAH